MTRLHTAPLEQEPAILSMNGIRVSTVLLAAAAVGTFLFSISRSIFDPLGADQMLFHYITRQITKGACLYSDLWTQNTPAIVAIHWVSMKLFGPTQMSLRILDAMWQLLTLLAIVLLAARDGRRWNLGLLAATMYSLTYYGFGPASTAQREGFAVLPMLMMVHGVMTRAANLPKYWSSRWRWAAIFTIHGLAGAMGFFVAFIKPPLGMCFGAAWLVAAISCCMTLRDPMRARSRITEAFTRLGGLTLGFLVACGLTWLCLIQLGWWQAYREVSAQYGFSEGFMLGPWMVYQEMPTLLAGAAILTALTFSLLGRRQALGLMLPGLTLLVMLVLLQAWAMVGTLLLKTAGVVLPATGAVLLCAWHGRSWAWRWMLLMGLCGIAAVVLQGRWSPYRYPPAYAAAAFLAASEVLRSVEQRGAANHTGRVWMMVCLAAISHLAVSHWGRSVFICSTHPYVLADRTLDEHYHLAAKGSQRVRHQTLIKVADYVQSVTQPNDPIATLYYEPGLYFACDRPPVHRLLAPTEVYDHMVPEFVNCIVKNRPKVLLARLPGGTLRLDSAGRDEAVFDAIRAELGASAISIAQHYHVAEATDEIAILRPNNQ